MARHRRIWALVVVVVVLALLLAAGGAGAAWPQPKKRTVGARNYVAQHAPVLQQRLLPPPPETQRSPRDDALVAVLVNGELCAFSRQRHEKLWCNADAPPLATTAKVPRRDEQMDTIGATLATSILVANPLDGSLFTVAEGQPVQRLATTIMDLVNNAPNLPAESGIDGRAESRTMRLYLASGDLVPDDVRASASEVLYVRRTDYAVSMFQPDGNPLWNVTRGEIGGTPGELELDSDTWQMLREVEDAPGRQIACVLHWRDGVQYKHVMPRDSVQPLSEQSSVYIVDVADSLVALPQASMGVDTAMVIYEQFNFASADDQGAMVPVDRAAVAPPPDWTRTGAVFSLQASPLIELPGALQRLPPRANLGSDMTPAQPFPGNASGKDALEQGTAGDWTVVVVASTTTVVAAAAVVAVVWRARGSGAASDAAAKAGAAGKRRKRTQKKASASASSLAPADDGEGEGGADEVEREAVAPATTTLTLHSTSATLSVAALSSSSFGAPGAIGASLEVFQDDVLGRGSYGTMVCRGKFAGRPVAVKRLVLESVELAEREVKMLQESDHHSNIIRYHWGGRDDRFWYIALELCAGSLYDFITRPAEAVSMDDGQRKLRMDDGALRIENKGKVAFVSLTTLISDMLSGLAHMHRLNIIHRDVKPQNVLVSATGRALISDFGLSKKLLDDQSSFRTTANHGTMGWSAPETLLRELLEPGASASQDSGGSSGSSSGVSDATRLRKTKSVDVFSAGCVIFFVLTGGRHPFGEDRLDWAYNIKHNKRDLAALAHDPEALDLVQRMIAHQPADRIAMDDALKHPFFWDAQKRLSFLQEASDRFEIEERDSALVRSLEAGAAAIVGKSWHGTVDTLFLSNLGKYRKYQEGSLRDLLRALRNKKHHYNDLPPDVQSVLGSLPDGFLHYFTSRFPGLLMYVYDVIAASPFRHDPMFALFF